MQADTVDQALEKLVYRTLTPADEDAGIPYKKLMHEVVIKLTFQFDPKETFSEMQLYDLNALAHSVGGKTKRLGILLKYYDDASAESQSNAYVGLYTDIWRDRYRDDVKLLVDLQRHKYAENVPDDLFDYFREVAATSGD